MNTNVYIPCCVLALLLIGKAPAQKHTAGRQQTIVAVDGLVLGVRVGAAWQAVDQSFAKGMRAIRFTPVTLDGVGKPFGPVGLVSDEFPQGCYIEAKSVPIAVNVAGIKPSVPRKPRIVRPTTKDQQLVASHLKAGGYLKSRPTACVNT